MKAKMVACDVNPEPDPYQAQTRGVSWTRFKIDLRDGEFWFEQEFNDNATPADEWHGIVITIDPEYRPDEDDARWFFEEGNGGTELVQEILDNSDVIWDGNNHVGKLNEDGWEAYRHLENDLNDLDENKYTWMFPESLFEGFELEGEETEEEIEKMLEDVEYFCEENFYLWDKETTKQYFLEERDHQKKINN